VSSWRWVSGVFVNTIDPHFPEAPQVTMWQNTADFPPFLCNQREKRI